MRAAISVTILTLMLFGSGCSLINDFGDYKFVKDSGVIESGDGSAKGEDAGGGTGGGGGSGGRAGTTEGGPIDAAADTGVETGPISDCDDTHPCTSPLECVSNKCVAPERKPSGVCQTSGGGITRSTGYTLRISVGTPQPMGVMSSDNFHITVGPGAGRP